MSKPWFSLPTLEVPRLEMPKLGWASFGRRILFRGVFLMLVLATLALAVALLQGEKERSYRNYQESFRKTQAEILARLRHPAGLLALLNPSARGTGPAGQPTSISPIMLPYSALDFDDQNKAQQAVETAGCSVRYADGSTICVAIGSNPYSGGFIYLVGGFDAGELVARDRVISLLASVHRARVTLLMRGETTQWIAPFESMSPEGTRATRGRLTGFVDPGGELPTGTRPVRDFRGWLWQSGPCLDGSDAAGCRKRAFFSIRLPVEAFREALFNKPRPVWPPADLDQVQVRFEMLAPDGGATLFDSGTPGAVFPPSLDDLRETLLPGETLQIKKLGTGTPESITLRGTRTDDERSAPWLTRLIRRLPVDTPQTALAARDIIATPGGSYEVLLSGDVRGIEQALGVVATRVSWFVAAMLVAIALAWLLIEVGLIRPISVLTRRAAAVSYNVQDYRVDGGVDKRIGELDVSDLRGNDELGILAGGLADLLQRVKDDVRREHIRAQQERDMWHAVGHEIMSPLQSLMVLHGQPNDASHRYVQRMQQAVRVLYSQASPSEALEAATLQLGAIDLDDFLRNVADNASFAGIADVRYERAATPVIVRADQFSLEDAVAHILRNAERYRPIGTPVTLALQTGEATVSVVIHNQGPQIPEELIGKIFEYGVSDVAAAAPAAPAGQAAVTGEHRGQGLFVAKTYMAKMGGTISAANIGDGVSFTLVLQRAGA
jgi:two-component system OmpR family sensor kinase